MRDKEAMMNAVKRWRFTGTRGLTFLVCLSVLFAGAAQVRAQDAHSSVKSAPLYKQANAPIEARIDDLMRRMTIEEKVRQLDMYAGAQALVDKRVDKNHAATDGVFEPEQAKTLFGNLGVGSIHDFYPTPVQSNAVQKWVIAHNGWAFRCCLLRRDCWGSTRVRCFRRR